MMNPSSKSILDIILNNQTGVAQQPTLQPPQPLHTNPGNALSHHQQHLSPQPYLYAPQHVAQFAGGAQNAFDTLDLELQSFVPPPQHQNIQRIVHQRTRSNSPVKVMKQQKTVKLHPIQIAQQQLQNHCSPSGCSSPTQTPLIDPNINPNQTLFVDTQALSKRKINFACTECRKAHKGCNGERPCQRCKKLGIEDKCKSTVRKKNRILANKYWKSIMSASANSPCSDSGTPTSELDFPGGHEMLHQGIDQMSEGNLLKQAAALVHQHFQSPSVAIPSASGTSSNNSSPDVSPRHQRVPSKSANTPPSHYMKQSPPQAGGYFFDSQQMNFANSAQPAAAVPPPAPAAVPQGGNPQEMYNKLYNDYFHYFYNSIRNEQLKNPNAASPTVRSPPLQPFANTPAAAPNVNNLAANISNMNIGNGTPKQQPSPSLSAKNSVKQETNLRDSVDNGEHNRQTSGDMFSFLSAQAPLDNQSSDNPFWLGRDADMNVDLLRRESQDSNFLRRESMDLPNAQFDDDNLETFFSQPPSSGTNTRTDEFDEFAILDNSMRQ